MHYTRPGRFLVAALLPTLLTACETKSENPVVFGQTQTVGISIGQSPTAQVPEFTFGYRDANIAVLPTVYSDAAGNVQKLGGITRAQNNEYNETFSVLGQFEVNTDNKVSDGAAKVGLGKFFATGLAAQKLSSGFACALAEGRDFTHCHPPGSTGGDQTN